MKTNINNLPLFISCDYMSVEGVQKTAHIQTRDFNGIQDAKIGDFSENWYIRPLKAMKKLPYNSLSSYKKACTNSLIKNKIAVVVTRYYTEEGETL